MRRRSFLTALLAPLVIPTDLSAKHLASWDTSRWSDERLTNISIGYAPPSPRLDLSVEANREARMHILSLVIGRGEDEDTARDKAFVWSRINRT